MKSLLKILLVLVITLMAIPTVYAETTTDKLISVEAQSTSPDWLNQATSNKSNEKLVPDLAQSSAGCPLGCFWATTCSGNGTYFCCRIPVPLQKCPGFSFPPR